MVIKLKAGISNYHINPNEEYRVVSITKYKGEGRKISYVLFSTSSGEPSSFDSDLFDILDGTIENEWVMFVEDDGNSFRMIHKKLAYSEFWEHFYDEDLSGAREAFKEVFPEYNGLYSE